VREALHFDAVVIGAGTAGLTAGTRLAQAGAKVCVLAKGVGSTHLAPGTIDVLGYAPERVDDPGRALKQLAADRPDHPYALLGVPSVANALDWWARTAAAGPLSGYTYAGGLERNHLLPTALGALRPSALVPETMGAGDRRGLRRVVIAGTPALRDFHPSLCADNLSAAGIEARGVSVDLDSERADMNAQGLARHFDDPAWRETFCARLLPLLGDEDHLGLPAMLGLRDPHAVLMDLQHRLGRWVFEIPTLPPSVPGMRLYEILRFALRAAGGRLVLGAEVVGSGRDGDRITEVTTRAAGRDLVYAAPWFVLASGGFASGAIELDSRWVTHDRVLGLPLRRAPGPGERRFAGAYLDDHPLARAGIAVGGDLRAVGAENVFVAGASLPGAEPWREGSGEGIALASGYRVAELIAGRVADRTDDPVTGQAAVA
jgi:glycerol-3-phosphate dehydrogenase subunit B